MVGRVALRRRAGQHRRHHLAGVTRRGADLQAGGAQGGHGLRHTRDQFGGSLRFLAHHWGQIGHQGVGVGLGRRPAMGLLPSGDDLGAGEDGADVVALGHAHVGPGGGFAKGYASGRERRHEGRHRRLTAEIDHRAGPVEDHQVEGRQTRLGHFTPLPLP